MAYIPFKERLWCSVADTCQFTGEGRTVVSAKISTGEIVSKLEGRRRLIHVPSLIAKYGLDIDRLGPANPPEPSGMFDTHSTQVADAPVNRSYKRAACDNTHHRDGESSTALGNRDQPVATRLPSKRH